MVPPAGPGVEAPAADALARIAHDLRSPLTVIRGLCHMLQGEAPRAERLRRLRLIDGEVERLSQGLERLIAPCPSPAATVALRPLVVRAAARHRAVGRSRGVVVSARVTTAASEVRGDLPELARALDNLIDNAVRHSPDGGRVRISLTRRRDELHLTVRDEGPGVTAADRERIFAPGERGSRPVGSGHGLGLSIAREIAQRHGGRLELSPLGPGARFRIVLTALDAGSPARGAA